MEGVLPDPVRWRRGRWVRLGPAFLEDLIAKRFATIDALSADTMSALELYVDLDAWREIVERFAVTRDPTDGALVWQTWNLARWVRATSDSEYDSRARRVGAVASSPLTAGNHGGY
jgi:hypothetical protein